MRIRAAKIVDFRNTTTVNLEFAPRYNALIGPNGQGKTNILEALYWVAALRPLRASPRRMLIRTGANACSVEAVVETSRPHITRVLSATLDGEARVLSKDHKRCDTEEFLGHLVATSFSPDDLQLSKGAPDARRRFLDRAVFNARPSYLFFAIRYARAIKTRARLLLEGADDAVLDAYDAVVAEAGAAVIAARARFCSTFLPTVVSTFDDIAKPAPRLHIAYTCTLARAHAGVVGADDLTDEDAVRKLFVAALFVRRERDRTRRETSVGPHRDDLRITLDDVPAKFYASQGQHRALVLALKIAEIAYLTDVLGEPPVLLLDDISSELDLGRSQQLFSVLQKTSGQVILTSTDARALPQWTQTETDPWRIYDVDAGTVHERSGPHGTGQRLDVPNTNSSRSLLDAPKS